MRQLLPACTIFAAAFLSATSNFLAAGELPDFEIRNSVQHWIDQLGSKRYQKREQATQELARIGAPALERLRLAATNPDPEVRRRAQQLIERFSPPAQPVEPPPQPALRKLKIFC